MAEGPWDDPQPAAVPEVQAFTPTQAQSAGPWEDSSAGPWADVPTPSSGYGQLLWGGLQRNFRQLQATPDSLLAIGAELSGDAAGLERHARAAAAIEEQAPKAEWELKNVSNPMDFTYWLTERFGENALTLLTAGAGGGAGALVGHLASKGLGATAVTRAALMRAGGTTGLLGTAVPTETAATAQEQFGVSDAAQRLDPNAPLTTQPTWSILAGLGKGALEVYTPLRIGNALLTPGRQLGRTVPGAIASVAAGEGATEFLQEGIDIYLRQLSDPAYEFWGQGPNWMGEGAWRLAEATVAGASIGGIVGTYPALKERQQERRIPSPDESGLLPGQQVPITDADIAPTGEGPGVQTASIRTQQQRNVQPAAPTLPPAAGELGKASAGAEAAIKRPDGKIFTGSNHIEAYNKAIVGLDQETADAIADDSIHGFMVNGKFLTNREAAVEVNKLQPGELPFEELGSENVAEVQLLGKTPDKWIDVYHGTTADLTSGIEPMAADNLDATAPPAISLSPTGEGANVFTQNMAGSTPSGAAVHRYRLNIEGFKEIDWLSFKEAFQGVAESELGTTRRGRDTFARWDPYTWQALLQQLKNEGVSGAVVRNMQDASGTNVQYVTFDKNRLQSAHKPVSTKAPPTGGFGKAAANVNVPEFTPELTESEQRALQRNLVRYPSATGWRGSDTTQLSAPLTEEERTQGYTQATDVDIPVPQFQQTVHLRELLRADVAPRPPLFTEEEENRPAVINRGGWDIVDRDTGKVVLRNAGHSVNDYLPYVARVARERRIAQLPKRGGLGPITELRSMVMPRNQLDYGIEEATIPEPREDLLAVSPLLRAALPVDTYDTYMDMLEANTPRFAIDLGDGKFDTLLYTDTDFEQATGTNDPQALERRVIRVDQRSLIPAAITADMLDLPPVSSNRLWFLPGTSDVEAIGLRILYEQVYERLTALRPLALLHIAGEYEVKNELRMAMAPLLKAGLRVIPSRGASFEYNGPMEGQQETAPRTTGRSKQIGFLDANGVFNQFREINDVYNNLATPINNGIPVAVDLNKFRPGEISALPLKSAEGIHGDIKFAENMSKHEQAVLFGELELIVPEATGMVNWPSASIEKFRKLMAKGVWFTPHQWSERLVTLRPISPDKLVPGINRALMGYDQTSSREMIERVGAFTFKDTQVHVDPALNNSPIAIKMREELSRYVVVVDRILKQLGIEGRLDVEVVAVNQSGGDAAAYIYPELGVIKFPIDTWRQFSDKQRRVLLWQALMHEVGHGVTYFYYSKLSSEIQQKLRYAYNKALLVKRSLPSTAVNRYGSATPEPGGAHGFEYYATFPEWLAEQFRRFTDSDQQVMNELDQVYKLAGQTLESYYKVAERNVGARTVVDLRQPDYYFSAFMQYLRDFGNEKLAMRQRERQQALYGIEEDIYASPQAVAIMKQVEAAMASMINMIPNKQFQLLFGSALNPNVAPTEPGAVARAIKYPDGVLIELAVGALEPTTAFHETRERFAHELIHTYRMLDIITRDELNFLYTMALRDKQGLEPKFKADLRRSVNEEAVRLGLDEVETERKYQDVLREETVAYYVGNYANSGVALDEAKPLLDRILQVLERIRNFMNGLGYRSRDDLLGVFFRGEMLSRGERAQANAKRMEMIMNMISEEAWTDVHADRIEEVKPGLWMAVEYSEGKRTNAETIGYYFFESPTGVAPTVGFDRIVEGVNVKGKGVSYMIMENKGPKGYDVFFTQSDGIGMLPVMRQIVERDLKQKIISSAAYTDEGFALAKLAFKDVVKYYVYDSGVEFWYSPNEIRKQTGIVQTIIRNVKEEYKKATTAQESTWYAQDLKSYQKRLVELQRLEAKIPKDIWTENKHLLEQMFMLERNHNRDGVQGSLVRAGSETDNAQLQQALGKAAPPGATTDSFTRAAGVKMSEAQQRMATALGIDFNLAAPPMPEVMNMRKLLAVADFRGATTSQTNLAYLKKVNPAILVSQEMDRIGFFSRTYLGLRQLLWRNEHITGLVNYNAAVENFATVISTWHREADDIARKWETDIASPAKREAVSQLMYWLTEQNYRSPSEVLAGLNRHPTTSELGRKMQALKLTSTKEQELLAELYQHPTRQALGKPKDIFGRFLDAVEAVSRANIIRTVTTPVQQQLAISELMIEMNDMRQRPYFPIARFGQHTITVRDALNKNNVKWFAAYEKHWERDAALAQVKAKFPQDDITKGRVPEEMFEFMGLPAPLIRLIRSSMPNLTAGQQTWLEDFERIHMPDKTFRKRWLPRVGTAGYSMDAFRTFAHYFQHGSRYLARLQYGSEMSQHIGAVRDTIDDLPNGSKRRMIVDYMTKHYNYLMEGGKDYAKFKAFVSLWQLGFSPAAAFMNLTQSPMVSLPWLSGHFGQAQGTSQFLASIKAARNLRKGFITSGFGNYKSAREEMVKQGRIDIGQAAELGAFAEGHNLNVLIAGTKRQKFYRNASYWGMYMFQKAEQANRELMMHAAWELAQKNPNHPRLQKIQLNYMREIVELQAKLSTPAQPFTLSDAIAFIFAKEAIDQTQGLYAPYARPTFMRKPLAGTLLIFYQFIQMMTYAFRFNPGTVQLWLMMAFMYGISGVPGADDLNELIKLLGRRVFNDDWDVKMHARRYARDITRGTIFDETGPDLLLHGISRYGFGLGLLPEGYAIGKFDASANGSMGKLVPGLYEAAHAINVEAKPEQFISDVTKRLAGAGFGMFFNLAQFGMEPAGSVDSHKWEAMLPRALRATAKAYRLAPEELGLPTLGPLQSVGAETARNGARLATFSVTDPEDLAALVTQALGFSPTKVSAMWERRREMQEVEQVYKARKIALYAQFDKALREPATGAIESVTQAIRNYNEEVRDDGNPSLQISVDQLRQSIQARSRARNLQEQGLSTSRNFIPVSRKIHDLFPNVKAEPVR